MILEGLLKMKESMIWCDAQNSQRNKNPVKKEDPEEYNQQSVKMIMSEIVPVSGGKCRRSTGIWAFMKIFHPDLAPSISD